MADDNGIEWDEPPARHKHTDWYDKLNEVKANPGRSARLGVFPVAKQANNLAATVRNAARHLGGGWEITSRRIPSGGYGVWAKWPVVVVPEDLEDDEPDTLHIDDSAARQSASSDYGPGSPEPF